MYKKKYCIVNGDDFGVCHGINQGILEAHLEGILTSASLMVNMPGAQDAAIISRDVPRLSVGVHVVLTREDSTPLFDFDSPELCRAELDHQWDRFLVLMGRPPTHLDAHHNIHRDARLQPIFVEWAENHSVPLREHSPVKYFSSFYGQWNGETHPEQISVENLCRMLEDEVVEGFTELSCHPGYKDPYFQSGYANEREIELRTICSPVIRDRIVELGIELISYQDFNALLPCPYGKQVLS